MNITIPALQLLCMLLFLSFSYLVFHRPLLRSFSYLVHKVYYFGPYSTLYVTISFVQLFDLPHAVCGPLFLSCSRIIYHVSGVLVVPGLPPVRSRDVVLLRPREVLGVVGDPVQPGGAPGQLVLVFIRPTKHLQTLNIVPGTGFNTFMSKNTSDAKCNEMMFNNRIILNNVVLNVVCQAGSNKVWCVHIELVTHTRTKYRHDIKQQMLQLKKMSIRSLVATNQQSLYPNSRHHLKHVKVTYTLDMTFKVMSMIIASVAPKNP